MAGVEGTLNRQRRLLEFYLSVRLTRRRSCLSAACFRGQPLSHAAFQDIRPDRGHRAALVVSTLLRVYSFSARRNSAHLFGPVHCTASGTFTSSDRHDPSVCCHNRWLKQHSKVTLSFSQRQQYSQALCVTNSMETNCFCVLN